MKIAIKNSSVFLDHDQNAAVIPEATYKLSTWRGPEGILTFYQSQIKENADKTGQGNNVT